LHLDDNDISCGQFFRKLKTVLFEQAMGQRAVGEC